MKSSTYHLIGIGGIGMSGLARIALQKRDIVSGSDVSMSPVIQSLIDSGAKIFIGHDANHLPEETATVVYSTDIAPANPEMEEAKKRNYPLLHRSMFLKELMEGSFPLLITGTHGKTTTSSLLAHMLYFLKEEPSYSVGGIVESLKSNAAFGAGKWFVAEADESDRSFLAYTPHGAIITNIGLDHLNYWHSEDNLLQGFFDFYNKIENKDLLFWCADDSRLSSLQLDGNSYGFSDKSDLKIEKVTYLGWQTIFTFSFKGKVYEDVESPLIGAHNALNAAAVFGLCLEVGLDEQAIRESLKQFLGVKRRMEKKGEVQNIAVYDDYGHHPTEIATTLDAVKRASKGRRIVVAFQPHRFSRVKDCFYEFAPALQRADLVVLTDIYSAGETPIDHIDSQRLYETFHGDVSAHYVPKEHLLKGLLDLVKPGDVVVSMGAGDITQIGPQLLAKLEPLV
jgi:UDP-N-acetylmuramate--alanine ligase